MFNKAELETFTDWCRRSEPWPKDLVVHINKDFENFLVPDAVSWIMVNAHRAVLWGIISENDLGKYMRSIAENYYKNKDSSIQDRKTFAFEQTRDGVTVDIDILAACIVSSGEGSKAKKTAACWNMATLDLDNGADWAHVVAVFNQIATMPPR